jgi:hypothetical protein
MQSAIGRSGLGKPEHRIQPPRVEPQTGAMFSHAAPQSIELGGKGSTEQLHSQQPEQKPSKQWGRSATQSSSRRHSRHHEPSVVAVQ